MVNKEAMRVNVARGRERHPIVSGIFILLGVVFCQIFLMLLLSGPESNGTVASYSDTDPYFVLVTPSAGDRSGKTIYVMDWDNRDFEIHPTKTEKVAKKIQLKIDWDGDSEFRLASPNEVKLLDLPYHHTFEKDDGTTEVTVMELAGAITIRLSAGNRSRTCTYSPDTTGPNFQH